MTIFSQSSSRYQIPSVTSASVDIIKGKEITYRVTCGVGERTYLRVVLEAAIRDKTTTSMYKVFR